jgi:hypothetical protein
MSYIYNREIQFADTAQNDAFGRLRTSEITSLLELKHTYDKQPLLESEVTDGTGESTHVDSTVVLQVSGADYIIRQSFASATYQPGKSQIFEASFAEFAITGGKDIIKRVGTFTSDVTAPYDTTFDGFFLESLGTTNDINFCIYQGGNAILTAPIADWLTSDYNPADIDWSLSQLMMVDYQWLGVGRVRFYMVIDGIPRLFYEYTHANSSTGVYMLSPNLPIRYELRSPGASGDTFVEICSQISMEGSLNSLYKPATIYNLTSASGLAAGAIYGILGFTIYDTTFRGVVARIRDISILQTTNDSYILRVIKNPVFDTISPTYTQLGASPIGYDDIGDSTYTLTLGSGEYVLESYVGAGGSLGGAKLELKDSEIKPGFAIDGTPDSYWITVQPLTTNATFRVAMNIEYFE